jgi:hypothetical protein
MARIPHLGQLLRERLDTVRRHEPRRLDIVFVPQLQQAIDAHGCAINAARHIGGIGGRACLRVDPEKNGEQQTIRERKIGTVKNLRRQPTSH